MNQTEMTHRRRRSGAGFFGLTRFECPPNLDKNDPYYNDCFNQDFFIGSSGPGGSAAPTASSGEIPGQPQNRTQVIIPIICGAIPFCEQPANHLCHITPVRSCKQCSLSKGEVFVFFFVLLALAIVIGNALIICVGWIRYRKKTLNKTDISKSSLAVGDMLIVYGCRGCCRYGGKRRWQTIISQSDYRRFIYGAKSTEFYWVVILHTYVNPFFVSLFVFLASVFWFCFRKRKRIGKEKEENQNQNYKRVLLLVFIPYNFSWFINFTFKEIAAEVPLNRPGTALANFVAVSYMFGYTSSLYHLIYMGIQRLYAVWKPIDYRLQSHKTVYISLACVWIVAIFSASSTVWFPQYLTGGFAASLLFYVPVLPTTRNEDFTPTIWVTIWFLLVPYFFMSIMTIGIGILTASKLKESKKLKEESRVKAKSDKDHLRKMERNLYITVVIMQAGFTVTLLPMAVISGLFFVASLDCTNFAIPYVSAFYLSVANSLTNVIIYSVREKKFRKSAKELFSVALGGSTDISTSSSKTGNTNLS